MTCEGCTRAEANPRSVYYGNACRECDARSLAQSPAFFDSVQANALSPAYRSALQFFGGNDWKALHERVRAWSDRINGATA